MNSRHTKPGSGRQCVDRPKLAVLGGLDRPVQWTMATRLVHFGTAIAVAVIAPWLLWQTLRSPDGATTRQNRGIACTVAGKAIEIQSCAPAAAARDGASPVEMSPDPRPPSDGVHRNPVDLQARLTAAADQPSVRLELVGTEVRGWGPGAVAPLCNALLHDENAIVRAEAAKQLSKQPTVEALEALHQALGDPSPRVVIEAARCLGELRSRASPGRLAEALQQHRRRRDGYGESIRRVIVSSLARIGDPGASDVLVEELAGDDDLSYHAEVVRALEKAGGSEAVQPLEEFLNELRRHEPTEPNSRFEWQRTIDDATNALAETRKRVRQ
jgi:hypothetical protein